MPEPYVYDKAKYHYGGNYPEDLPEEQAFVHTGIFLGWVIDNDLYSDEFREDMEGYIAAFKARHITGAAGSDSRIKRDPAKLLGSAPWPGQLNRSVVIK
jgi:hypothetical protein